MVLDIFPFLGPHLRLVKPESWDQITVELTVDYMSCFNQEEELGAFGESTVNFTVNNFVDISRRTFTCWLLAGNEGMHRSMVTIVLLDLIQVPL